MTQIAGNSIPVIAIKADGTRRYYQSFSDAGRGENVSDVTVKRYAALGMNRKIPRHCPEQFKTLFVYADEEHKTETNNQQQTQEEMKPATPQDYINAAREYHYAVLQDMSLPKSELCKRHGISRSFTPYLDRITKASLSDSQIIAWMQEMKEIKSRETAERSAKKNEPAPASSETPQVDLSELLAVMKSIDGKLTQIVEWIK